MSFIDFKRLKCRSARQPPKRSLAGRQRWAMANVTPVTLAAFMVPSEVASYGDFRGSRHFGQYHHFPLGFTMPFVVLVWAHQCPIMLDNIIGVANQKANIGLLRIALIAYFWNIYHLLHVICSSVTVCMCYCVDSDHNIMAQTLCLLFLFSFPSSLRDYLAIDFV